MNRQNVSNVIVGKPQVSPTLPSHVKGIHGGNNVGNLERERGFRKVNAHAVSTAERSTGINPGRRNSILPGSPNLQPA